MKFLAIQAKKIGASRKSLYSSTKFLKTAVRSEDRVEPYPGASWAPSEMMSEGLTLNAGGGREGGFGVSFFCLKGNLRFSGENVRWTCAAHPLSAGTSCAAFICYLLKSLRVCESCCADRYCGARAFILRPVKILTDVGCAHLWSARGRERCSPWWP